MRKLKAQFKNPEKENKQSQHKPHVYQIFYGEIIGFVYVIYVCVISHWMKAITKEHIETKKGGKVEV